VLLEALKIVGVIGAIVLGGRLLLRPLLRWIAKSRTPEIFTAASLLLVVGIAYLMVMVGLSMALGAFLAGVLLADSEYRSELEADIEPFKGLLLGLFFIAVGMSIDFGVLMRSPWLMAGILLGFLALKAVVIYTLAKVAGVPYQERPVFTLLLAQGGEFAFVVFQAAAGAPGVFGRNGLAAHRRGGAVHADQPAAAGAGGPRCCAATPSSKPPPRPRKRSPSRRKRRSSSPASAATGRSWRA
jgi:glutathione-regulated potassium-efflux system ancillary protein KefC